MAGNAEQLDAEGAEAAAEEEAVLRGQGGHALLGEEAHAQRAEHAAAEMDGRGAHGIVDPASVEEADANTTSTPEMAPMSSEDSMET